MTILTTYPPGTRVVCPGGIPGTVTQVLAVFQRTGREPRYPILVSRDDGSVRAYAPSELTVIATSQQQIQARGMPLP